MSNTPFFSRRPVIITMIVIGAIVLVAHIIGAVWLSMTVSSWMSGAAIGLLLLIFALAHVLIPGHVRNHVVNINRQWLYFFIALISGVIAGLLATLLVPSIGWWFLIPAAVATIALGRYLDGNPQTKSVRLFVFGFATCLLFLSTSGLADVVSSIEISLFAGTCALLLGFLTHLAVGPRKK